MQCYKHQYNGVSIQSPLNNAVFDRLQKNKLEAEQTLSGKGVPKPGGPTTENGISLVPTSLASLKR